MVKTSFSLNEHKQPLAERLDRAQMVNGRPLVGTDPDNHFSRLTRLTQRLFQVPIVCLSFVDEEQKIITTTQGFEYQRVTAPDFRELPFTGELSTHNGQMPPPLVIEDIHHMPESAYHPWLIGAPNIRSYANQVITDPHGAPIGLLAVMDVHPRQWQEDELLALRDMATLVERELMASYQRQEMEERLQITHQRYHLPLEASPDPIVFYDMQGHATYINPAFTALFGWLPNDVYGKRIDFVPPENLSETQEKLKVLFTTGRVSEFETQRFTKSGTIVDVDINAARIDDEEGNSHGMVVVFRDMTKRKAAEEAKRQSEKQFRDLVENLQVGVLLQGPQTEILVANQAAIDILGLSQEQLLGQTSFEFKWHVIREDGSFFPAEERPVSRAIATARPQRNVVMGILHDNHEERIWLLVNTDPQLDESGQVQQVICSFSDISELKAAEEERRVAQQLRIAADISQQLSTILEPERLLQATVSLLQERFDLYHVHAYLLDNDTEQLVMQVGSGEVGRQLRKQGHAIPLVREQSIVAQVARTQQAKLVHDTREDANFMPNPLLPDTRSEAAVPLVAGGRLLGVLDVQDNHPSRFNRSDLDVLNTVAGQVATALENARLFAKINLGAEAQKQSEAALRQSEQRLRTVVSSADLVLFAIDQEGIFRLSEGRGLSALGLEPGQVVGLSVFELYKPFPDVITGVRRALRGEALHMVANVGALYFDTSYSPWRDENGQLLGTIGVGTNVTEQMQAEQALRHSELKLRSLIQSANEAIILSDETGLIIDWNQGAEQIFGYTKAEILNQPITHLMPEPYREAHTHGMARLQRTGETKVIGQTVELIGLHKEGDEFPIELSLSTWQTDQNHFYSAFIRNITQRQQTQQALQESQRTLATLMSNLPGMAYRCLNDQNWTMEFVSEGALELTGHPPSDLINNRLLAYGDLIHPDDQDAVWAQVQVALESKTSFELTYRICTAQGEERWVWEQGLGVYDSHGELLALEGFISNIHERIAAEQEVEQQRHFLRQVIDINPHLIFAKDRSGRFSLVNKAVAEVYGTTVSELEGKTDADFNPNLEEVEHFRQKDLAVMDSLQEEFIPEEQITDAQGNLRWLQTIKRPIVDSDGKGMMVLGVATDITQRKRATLELARFADQLRSAAELAQRLGTILSLAPLLTEAVEQVQTRFDLYHVHVYLLDETGKQLVMAAGSGEVGEQLREWHHAIPIQREQSLVARAARTQQLVRVNDVSQTTNFMPNPLLPHTSSEVAVPLVAGGRLLGVLDVQDVMPYRFTDSDVDILSTVAGLLATALESTRLFTEVAQAQQEQQTIFEHVPAMIWYKDTQNRMLRLNPPAAAAIGRTVEEMEGQTLDQFYPPEDAQRFHEEDLEVIRTGQAKRGLIESYRHPSTGDIRWVQLDKVPYRNQEGQIIGVLILGQDITESRLAEEARRRSEANLIEAQRLAHLGSWEWNIQGDGSLLWSEEHYRILGVSSEHFYPTLDAFTNALHPEDRDPVGVALTEAMVPEHPTLNVEFRIVRPDGTIRLCEAQAQTFFDAEGVPKRMVGTIQDLTEQKLAEQRLRESEARQRALLAASPDIMFRFSREGIYLDVEIGHDNAARLPNPHEDHEPSKEWINANQLLGQPLTDILPLSVANLLAQAIKAAIDSGETQTVEYQLPTEIGIQSYEARLVRSGPTEAIAIVRNITHRAKAEEERAKRLRYEEGLARASQTLLAEEEMKTALQQAIEHLREATGASRVYIFENFINDAGDLCSRQHYEAVGEGVVSHLDNAALQDFGYKENGFERWVTRLSRGEPISGRVTDFPTTEQIILDAQQILSILVLPIHIQGKWYGLIGFDDVATARDWQREDYTFLRTAAGMFGNYIDRQQTTDALQISTNQLRTAAEVTEQLNAILAPDRLLDQMVSLLQERFGLYHVHVYLMDEVADVLSMQAGSGHVGRLLRERKHQIRRDASQSLVARAAREEQVILVGDVRQEANFLPNPLLPDTRSELALPLMVRGIAIGVLDLQDNKPYRFNQTDVDTFSTMAGQIATALENARLFEEVQRISETRLAAVVDNALDGIITTNADGVIESFNPAAEQIFGYSELEVLGQHHHISLLMPEFVDAHLGYQETIGQHKNGNRFPIDLGVQEVAIGRDTLYITMVRDITSRKMAEEELAEQVRLTTFGAEVSVAFTRQRSLSDMLQQCTNAMIDYLDAALARIWVVPSLGVTVNADDAQAANLSGPDSEQLHLQASSGLPIALEGEGSPIDGQAMLTTITQTGQPYLSEHLATETWILDQSWVKHEGLMAFASYPLIIEGKTVGLMLMLSHKPLTSFATQALGVAADIIALGITHQQAAEALVGSERRFRELVENLQVGVMLQNRQRQVLLHNQAATDLLQLTPAQLMGEADIHEGWQLIQEDGSPYSREALFHPLEEGQPVHNVVLGVTTPTHKQPSWLLVNAAPQLDPHGNLQQLIYTFGDITERKEIEEQRRYSKQLRIAAELADQLNAIHELEPLLETLVSQLQQRFDLYHVHVYLLDETHDQLMMYRGSGEAGAKLRSQGHAIPLARQQSLVVQAARERTLIVVNDVRNDPNFLPNPLLPDTRSEVSVPILFGDEVLGVLDVQDNQPYRFGRADLDVFRTLAHQVATALENARLFEQVQQNLSGTRIRFEISQKLATAQTEAEVLDAMIAQVNFFPSVHTTISTIDSEADDFVLVTQRSHSFESGVPPFQPGTRFEARSLPALGNLRPDEPSIRDDLHHATEVPEAFKNLLLSQGIRSTATFPITVGKHWLGVLNLMSQEIGYFNKPDVIDLYQSFVDQSAVALRGARLFDDIQHTAERLREVDRLKSEFLANMSHELRTPLNSIIGYSEIMLMGINGPLNAETTEDIQAIRNSGQHLLRLINDILDLAKIEAGRMALEIEPVNLNSLLDEVRVSNLALLRHKPLEIIIVAADTLPLIQADRLRLNQIMTNLVSNAIKFTEEGLITLSATQEADWVELGVEDQGIGMKESDLETIFAEFRQVDGSSTRRAEGTGLGLAITKHLVTMHGGEISVKSQLDQGSTFTIRLPIDGPPSSDQIVQGI